MGVPEVLPLFPLNTVLMPGGLLPLHIFEERYRVLVRRCLDAGGTFGVVLILEGEEVGGEPVVASVGTEARLLAAQPLPDGRYNILVEGGRRFRVRALSRGQPYLQAEVEWLEAGAGASESRRLLRPILEEYLRTLGPAGVSQYGRPWEHADDEVFSFAVARILPLGDPERQDMLETVSTDERLRKSLAVMAATLRGLQGSRAT